MPKAKATASVANKGKLITTSGFSNYDLCLNTYVGCEFGCTYCYVRFFIKDDNHDWGEFVRIREHVKDRLAKELDKGYIQVKKKKIVVRTIKFKDARLVLGTMTDGYQPQERKARVTRAALKILTQHSCQFQKVGIFTRSPLVLEDLELIKKLPNARIHYTITPFPDDVKHKIEPITPKIDRQWKTVEAIVKAGIRLHLNLSPIIPTMSESFIASMADNAARIAPAEYFIDPVQPYKEARLALEEALQGDPRLVTIRELFDSPDTLYENWKVQFRAAWEHAWFAAAKKHKNTKTLPIWCDHQNDVWVDLRTGEQMNHSLYGDDLAACSQKSVAAANTDSHDSCEEDRQTD